MFMVAHHVGATGAAAGRRLAVARVLSASSIHYRYQVPSLFGGGIVVDLLKAQPRVVLGGRLFDNPHYLTPDSHVAEG